MALSNPLGGPNTPINTGTFVDPFASVKQKEEALKRRREAAKKMIEESQQKLGVTYTPQTQGSAEFGPLPQIAVAPDGWQIAAQAVKGIVGGIEQGRADKEAGELDKESSDIERARFELERRMKEKDQATLWEREDAKDLEKAEADYNTSLRTAEAKKIQDDIDHQQALELKKVPQVIQSTSTKVYDGLQTGKQGAARPTNGGTTSFGGVAQQVGVDPRTGQPVFRHKQSGGLITFDEVGTPTLYQGLVAPEPTAAAKKADERLPKYQAALQEARDFLKDYDPRSFDQLDPQKLAKAQSILANLQLVAKDAYDMGAPQAGDLAMLEKVYGSLTGPKAAYLGKEGLDEQLRLGQERQGGSILPKDSPMPAKAAAPAVGTVKGGYKFKGGDPANPASWEKI